MNRIEIVKAQPQNTQFLYDLYALPEIQRGHGMHRPISAIEWRNIITGFYEGWQHTYVIMYGPVRAGHLGIANLDKEDRRAEIGIAIHPSLQNKGIATDALDLFMKQRLCVSPENGGLGIQLLLAYIVADNEPSKRLFASADFTHQATISGYHRKEGRRTDRTVWTWSPSGTPGIAER